MPDPKAPDSNTTEPAKTDTTPSAPGQLTEEDLNKVSGGSSVSNVLKTRHDTAKNSISNVR